MRCRAEHLELNGILPSTTSARCLEIWRPEPTARFSQRVQLKKPRTASSQQSLHPVGQDPTKQHLWALRDRANSQQLTERQVVRIIFLNQFMLNLNQQSLPNGKQNQINTCVNVHT